MYHYAGNLNPSSGWRSHDGSREPWRGTGRRGMAVGQSLKATERDTLSGARQRRVGIRSTGPSTTVSSDVAKTTPRFLPVLVVALLGLLAVWRVAVAGPPPGDDWGQYLSHARALLEGRSYSDIGYLFSPPAWTVGPATFPPGLPLTLVPLLAISDEPTALVRLVMHGFLVAFLMFAWRYFSHEGDRTLAWGMVALLGTGFLLGNSAMYASSDLGMCAFIWAVLTLAEGTMPWSWKRTALVGALGLGAILYRIAAVPLVAAVVLWVLVRCVRARKLEVGWQPLFVALLWAVGFWGIFVTFAAGTQVMDSVGAAIGVGDSGVFAESLRFELSRVGGKILRYRLALTDTYLYAFPSGLANRSYHVLALGLTLVGLWVWVKAKWTRLSTALFVSTCGFLLAAPVWNPRYAWVLTPFVAYGLLLGISTLTQRWASPERSKLWASTGAVLVSVIAIGTAASREAAPALPSNAEWREVGRAVQAESSGRVVRAASNRPRVLTWLTRIPAAGMAPDLGTFITEVERLQLTHVVLSRRASEEHLIARFDSWVATRPQAFELIASVGDLEAYRIEFEEP